MSYLVCHIQKFKISDIKGMQIHNQRESENSKNKDIDRSRSHLNYDLHNREDINYYKRVREVIESQYKGNRAIRKDAVTMVGILITSDSNFFKDKDIAIQKNFFELAYQKLKEMYGEQNIISAVVHMDEKTPHMHFNVVPMKEGKLSAKTIFDRNGLRNLQEELPKYLQNNGFDVKRGEKNSKAKHKDTYEYKEEQIKNKYNSLLEELKNEKKKEKIKLERQIEKINDMEKKLNDGLSSVRKLNQIEPKKSILTKKVTLTEEDFNILRNSAQQGAISVRDYLLLEKENKKLQEEVKNLEEDNKQYLNKNDEYLRIIRDCRNVLKKQKKDIEKKDKDIEILIKAINKLDIPVKELQEKINEVIKEERTKESKTKKKSDFER